MELKRIEGTIEQVVLDKTKKGNDFVKIIVDTGRGKRTVNIFNLELYDKERISKGKHITVDCTESTYEYEGELRTSLIADSIIGKEVQKVKELPKKEETPETDESSVESIMEKCIRKSYQILSSIGEKEGIEFGPEDVRTVGVAMAIESYRRFK